METPRILAIDDVHLWSPPAAMEETQDFYVDLLGFDVLPRDGSGQAVRFRGRPRSGPKLVISLGVAPESTPARRQVLIQVADLTGFAASLGERGVSYEEVQGWSFYDRRLTMLDPAGNRVEVVAYHGW
jgi:catechol 2,3-dioxygenase-like lactoylglutathione lyase family enzyme